MDILKKTVGITRFLYLIMTICGLFSLLYIPSKFVIYSDAALTASNIKASEGLFRLGIVSDAIVFLLEIIVPIVFYLVFKSVNKTISLIAAVFRLAMAVIQGFNVLNHLVVLLILNGTGYLGVFEPKQLNALVVLFLNIHNQGFYIWQAFFGIHCLLLGYLIYKSDYLPKILGVLLALSGVGYLSDTFGNFLWQDYKATFGWIVMGLACGELAFTIWFLVKGFDLSKVKAVNSTEKLIPTTT